MIVSGGENISSVEVEGVLLRHPAVQEAAVVGMPHEEWGEAVHAEVILNDSVEVAESDLIAYVKEQIGSFKTPKSVLFVEELPLSVVGKVLRKDVRKKYWGGQVRSIG